MSERARAWCGRIGQPLPALTMARAHLGLGRPDRAKSLLREAHGLVGDRIFGGIGPEEAQLLREALGRKTY